MPTLEPNETPKSIQETCNEALRIAEETGTPDIVWAYQGDFVKFIVPNKPTKVDPRDPLDFATNSGSTEVLVPAHQVLIMDPVDVLVQVYKLIENYAQ